MPFRYMGRVQMSLLSPAPDQLLPLNRPARPWLSSSTPRSVRAGGSSLWRWMATPFEHRLITPKNC